MVEDTNCRLATVDIVLYSLVNLIIVVPATCSVHFIVLHVFSDTFYMESDHCLHGNGFRTMNISIIHMYYE